LPTDAFWFTTTARTEQRALPRPGGRLQTNLAERELSQLAAVAPDLNALNFPGAMDWPRAADWGQSALRPGQKANGQRKSGPGPDWPALPELGRAVTMVMAQGFRKLVLPLALTFYPLPQERKSRWHVFIFSADRPANPVARVSKDAGNVKALSLGSSDSGYGG